MNMKKKTYTVKEVAEVLAYHRGTVKEFLRKGKIKGLKVGNQWRVTEDEIKRILGLHGSQH